jgi:hypothetical protein
MSLCEAREFPTEGLPSEAAFGIESSASQQSR